MTSYHKKKYSLLSILLIISLFMSMLSKNIIPVIYGTDHENTMPTLVSMTSVCYNANSETYYELKVLVSEDFTEEDIKIFKSVKENFPNSCNVTIINMEKAFNDDLMKKGSYLTTPTLYRLKASSLFPQYDKMIYLDGDTVINEDLTTLFSLDMKDNYYLGIYDNGEAQRNKHLNHSLYINSGVLLMNLTKLREDKMENQFEEFLNQHKGGLSWPDQTTINYVCKGKVGRLPFKYGVGTYAKNMKILLNFVDSKKCLSYEDCLVAFMKPSVIHYLSPDKPWKKKFSNSYFNYYLLYVCLTNYAEQILGDIMEQNSAYHKDNFLKEVKTMKETFKEKLTKQVKKEEKKDEEIIKLLKAKIEEKEKIIQQKKKEIIDDLNQQKNSEIEKLNRIIRYGKMWLLLCVIIILVFFVLCIILISVLLKRKNAKFIRLSSEEEEKRGERNFLQNK